MSQASGQEGTPAEVDRRTEDIYTDLTVAHQSAPLGHPAEYALNELASRLRLGTVLVG